MDSLGIYVQVPFCASKCSFCNFSSRVSGASVLDPYTSALETEIRRLPEIHARAGIDASLLDLPVDTLYFGGGTPSLLGTERLSRVIAALRERFRFMDKVEFTLELTPGSADDDFLRSASGLGIDRLSIGAQSFNDRELSSVGRLHSAADTIDLVARARKASFANLSLDLIGGLPFQTEASWRHSLETVAGLGPEHVSVYLFEVDEKSRLGGEVLRHGTRYHAEGVPGEEFQAWAYETARNFLAGAGYDQYEISNFARGGRESRHNQKYWRLDAYLGLGAGAHSFDGARRWSNLDPPQEYRARLAAGKLALAELRQVSPEEQLEEFFFLGLRQSAGVDLDHARRRWGTRRVRDWEPVLAAVEGDGLIERSGAKVRLAERAYLVSNEVFAHFVAE